MLSKNTWTHLFVALLIVCAGMTSIVLQKKPQNDIRTYKEKYFTLKQIYIDLAKSQSRILELLLRGAPDLQTLLPEYKNVSKTEFSEQIRCQIRALKLQADELERE